MAVVLSVGDWKLNLPPEVRGVIHGQWTRLKIDAFTHLFIAAKCIFTDYCLFLIQTPPSLFLDLYNILCFDASHIRKLIFANGFENGSNLNNAYALKISLACSKMPFSWKNLWREVIDGLSLFLAIPITHKTFSNFQQHHTWYVSHKMTSDFWGFLTYQTPFKIAN